MSLDGTAVDAYGTVLTSTDSGAPAGSSTYTTIFAVHGMAFNHGIFKKVQALCGSHNIRFVAVNRRDYGGSTRFSETERGVLTSATDEEKALFINSRGIEFATFIDKFNQKEHLPEISPNGDSGGFALLGWSAGNLVTAAALSNIEKLSPQTQELFKKGLRAHIMHEPPSVAFGLPASPMTWSPYMDASVPAKMHTRLATQWLTSYFDHGDFNSEQGLNAIEYIVSSCRQAPTIYSFSQSEFDQIIDESIAELPGMFMSTTQANAVYRRACYGAQLKTFAPRLKTTLIVGDATVSFCITALLSIRADNEAQGTIQINLVPQANHFWQWEEPEDALRAYIQAL
ncbi:hypothetical protein B0H11DRAFT_2296847 [Mycena galericulata]|nr:hypothetical protein B0H11DRAFT_2296847 [Mycena galericulata]